jgi:hypothetical protein
MPSTECADDALPQKDAAMNGAKGEPRRPDKSIANIYDQNKKWKNSKLAEDKDYFKTLGSGHAPDYMWIGKYNFDWLVGWPVRESFKHAVPCPSQSFSLEHFELHFRLLRCSCPCKRDYGRGLRIRLCCS